MDRRAFLSACAASAAFLEKAVAVVPAQRSRMGVVLYSYMQRRAAEPRGPLEDPLGFLEHCRSDGAGGGQVPVGVRDREYSARVRRFLDSSGMYLEGIVRMPRETAEVERFEAEVRTARDCGANILRCGLLNGRRYETFRTEEAFRDFARQARQSLTLAKPILERHQVVLGVENHKDWRAGELAGLIREVRSPQVGVCLDIGNNLSLLETPQETLDLLAPLAVTTHIKDMAVEEYREGFLLAEVPLGTGLVDLPRTVQTLRRARPDIHLNLEMITRDPLRIPCLTRDYWATLEAIPGRRLAEILTLVRANSRDGGLPRVNSLEPAQRVEREEQNVRSNLQYSRQRLES